MTINKIATPTLKVLGSMNHHRSCFPKFHATLQPLQVGSALVQEPATYRKQTYSLFDPPSPYIAADRGDSETILGA